MQLSPETSWEKLSLKFLLSSLNFLSFNPISHKVAIFSTLVYRAFGLCSNEILFHLDVKRIFTDLFSNGYLLNWLKDLYHDKIVRSHMFFLLFLPP